VAKKRENTPLIKGLHRSRPALSRLIQDCGYPTGQALCTAQPEVSSHSDEELFGEEILVTTVKSIEQRIHGLVQDRARIGRDLHDSVLQSLYAIGINLEIARSTDHPPPQDPQRSQGHLVEQLHRVIQEVRGMIISLDSGMIEDFDLTEELKSLQETYQQSGRLRVNLDLQPIVLQSLSTKERSELLNIAREALSNCARHAEATQVTVALRLDGTTVCLRIIDDGKGFTPTEHSGQGYGLTNMHIRARKLGGALQVRSLIRQGTAISVDFALPLIPTNA